MRKIISFGLWGARPMYTGGALDNADLAQKFYPDWTCRFYLGASVPAKIAAQLQAMPNVETVRIEEPEDLRAAFWRFRAAEDADVLLCRDADSRFGLGERAAVEAWLASGMEAHAFQHNGIQHPDVLLAGCLGLRGQALRDLTRELAAWKAKPRYGDEEEFLRLRLLPLLRQRDALLLHEDTWGWGTPPPRPLVDAVGSKWYHNPGLYRQAFPLHRGLRHTTGLLAPPPQGWPLRLLARLVRPFHKGWSARISRATWPKDAPQPHLADGHDGLVQSPYDILHIPIEARRYVHDSELEDPDDCSGILDSIPQVPKPGRAVIAFAVPGNDPALVRGALDNAEAATHFYPGWICRFHVDASVPPEQRERLAAAAGAEVHVCDRQAQGGDPRLWGLQAAADCDVLLLRSPRARLNLHDRQAVHHWLASAREMHSLHDHPRHRWHTPTPDLLGLRGDALRWAAEHRGRPDLLRTLAREFAHTWLRHDGFWHLGTPMPQPHLPRAYLPPMLGYHGMPWELSEEYGGLPTPQIQDLHQRERGQMGVRFCLTAKARYRLHRRGLDEGPRERWMAAFCTLLYGP